MSSSRPRSLLSESELATPRSLVEQSLIDNRASYVDPPQDEKSRSVGPNQYSQYQTFNNPTGSVAQNAPDVEAVSAEQENQENIYQPHTPSRKQNAWQMLTRILAENEFPPLRRLFLAFSFKHYDWLCRLDKPAITSVSDYKAGEQHIAKAAKIEGFWQGVDLVTDYAWPLALFSMLAFDGAQYRNYPSLRYGTNLLDVFLGKAKNGNYLHNALVSQLGSDLVPEWQNWSLFIFPFGIAITSGLYFLYRKNDQHKKFKTIEQSYEAAVEQDAHLRFALERSKFSLDSIIFELFWNQDLSSNNQRELFEIIRNYTLSNFIEPSWPRHLQAIRALGQIARLDKNEYAELPNEAYQQLIDLASDHKRFLTYIAANYELWRRGESSKSGFHILFFLSVLPLTYFPKYHLYRLFFEKLLQAGFFIRDKRACHTEEKSWVYAPTNGEYACHSCDGEYALERNAGSVAGCINDLFNQPQTPDKFISEIKQLLPKNTHAYLPSMTAQPWITWQDQQFDSLVDAFMQPAVPSSQFTDLNFATTITSPYAISLTKSSSLAKLIQYAEPTRLTLNNVNIGDTNWQLLSKVIGNQTQELNLANTLLTSASAQTLFAQPYPALQSLDLSNNLLADQMIPSLKPFLPQLLTLKIGGNPLKADGINALFNVTQPAWVKLDLSNVYMRDANFTLIGQTLQSAHSLQTLVLSRTQLDENVAVLTASLQNSTLNYLDLSQNDFDTAMIKPLFDNQHSLPATVILDDNLLYDDFFINMTVPSGLKKLSLARNLLTSASVPSLTQTITNSQVYSLSLAGNSLSSTDLAFFLQKLVQYHHPLSELDLSALGMDVSDFNLLAPYLEQLPLKKLMLDKNNLHGAVSFLQTLIAQGLEELSVNDTDLTDSDLTAILPAIPGSNLTILSITDNPAITDTSYQQIAVVMLPAPYNQTFTTNYDIDMARAISRLNPNNKLTLLDLSRTGIQGKLQPALCHALPASQLQIIRLPDAIQYTDSGIPGCPAALAGEDPLQLIRRLHFQNQTAMVLQKTESTSFDLPKMTLYDPFWLDITAIGIAAAQSCAFTAIVNYTQRSESANKRLLGQLAALAPAVLALSQQPYQFLTFLGTSLGMGTSARAACRYLKMNKNKQDSAVKVSSLLGFIIPALKWTQVSPMQLLLVVAASQGGHYLAKKYFTPQQKITFFNTPNKNIHHTQNVEKNAKHATVSSWWKVFGR